MRSRPNVPASPRWHPNREIRGGGHSLKNYVGVVGQKANKTFSWVGQE